MRTDNWTSTPVLCFYYILIWLLFPTPHVFLPPVIVSFGLSLFSGSGYMSFFLGTELEIRFCIFSLLGGGRSEGGNTIVAEATAQGEAKLNSYSLAYRKVREHCHWSPAKGPGASHIQPAWNHNPISSSQSLRRRASPLPHCCPTPAKED